MPTIQSMQLPLPKNWQEFEDITRDALAISWRSPNLQKNGRPGQKQKGVDIYGTDHLGRLTGIQCKKYQGPLQLKTVEAEIANAEKFVGQLSTLFIATTAEHDSQLQEHVRVISESRSLQGEFAVGIIFWDEIVASLVLNPAVLSAHYPNLVVSATTKSTIERKLAALEFGYFGADISAYILLMYGEFGWMAQVDPDELTVRLRILGHLAGQLLPVTDATEVISALDETRSGCLAPKQDASDWEPVLQYAKRASSRISAASSSLTIDESRILDLALQLGKIYHHSDDRPSQSIRNGVRRKLLTILGDAHNNSIDAIFTEADAKDSGYLWAMKLYSFLDRTLRYET